VYGNNKDHLFLHYLRWAKANMKYRKKHENYMELNISLSGGKKSEKLMDMIGSSLSLPLNLHPMPLLCSTTCRLTL
jgi:hypothetical protein